MKDGDLFERKEVKLWLNHEKNYDLKSNFMFEENTIKIDWRTISEHLKKTIIHAINQRETKFENIYLVFSHKYSNECIQKISHCMEVNKNQDQMETRENYLQLFQNKMMLYSSLAIVIFGSLCVYALSELWIYTRKKEWKICRIFGYDHFKILKNISNKSAFVTKLEMHLEKHLGNFSNYSATTDYSNLKLLSIAMIDLIDKSINNVVAKKINFVTANNPNLDINKYEIKSTEISNYNMYRAVFLASDNKLNEALELINNCIAKFESENDHYYYNAYYIKAEILRIMNDFSEAYKFYLKSSGILDDHVDINLLDQNYFSTKSLELLGYVHGDASDRIIAYKESHYDKLNHKKYISNIKIPEMYDECLKEKINLRFNQKILNIINETSLNDKDWSKLKTILLNNIFIIL